MDLGVVTRLAWFGSLLVACGQAPPTQAEQEPAQQAADPRALYLVWSIDEAGRPTTWLVEPTLANASGYQVLGERAELWLAARDHVWQWKQELDVRESESCELGDEDTPSASPCKVVRPSAALVPMIGGRPLSLHDPEDDEILEGDVEERLVPQASIGDYLFAVRHTALSGCGAHGSKESVQLIVDLSRGELVQPPELAGDVPRTAALAQLRRRGLEGFDAGSLAVTAMFPAYADGRLELAYQLSADTCYACSDGQWSSYTVSTRVRAPKLPPNLAAYAELPAPVAAFVHTHVGSPTWGWTRTSLERRQHDALTVVFEAGDADEALAAANAADLRRG